MQGRSPYVHFVTPGLPGALLLDEGPMRKRRGARPADARAD